MIRKSNIVSKANPNDGGVSLQASESADKIKKMTSIYKSYLLRNKEDRADEADSWMMVANEHFTPEDKITLGQRGQIPVTLNYIREKVDTQHGMLTQRPWAFRVETDIGRKNTKAVILNYLILRDRDLGGWAKTESDLTRDMLVHQGIVEIYRDYRIDPINGTINIRRRLPGEIVTSPDWRTDDESDNEYMFSAQYLTPEQIKSHCKTKSKEIDDAIKKRKEADFEKSSTGRINKIYDRSPEFQDRDNDRYLYIEAYSLEKKPKLRLWDKTTGDFLDDLTPEDQDLLRQDLHEGLNPDILEVMDDEYSELKIFSFAPGLSLSVALVDEPHEIQIGRYPFLFVSAYNDNGKRSGLVKIYKDAQRAMNKSHATLLNWQMTAANGIEFYDDSIFDDPEIATQYKQEKNIPGGLFKVGNIEKIPRSRQREQPPADLWGEMDRLKGFMDSVGPTPNSQGQSDTAGESGALFNSRTEQSNVKSQPQVIALSEMQRKVGKSYIELVPPTYGEDVFKLVRNGETIIVNGSPETSLKDVGELEIRVVMGPTGTSLKREYMNMYAQLQQNETDPLKRAMYSYKLIENLPNVTDYELEELKSINKLIMDTEKKARIFQSIQWDSQISQIALQQQGNISQLMGGPQQGNGPAGPATPQPGPGQTAMQIPPGGTPPAPPAALPALPTNG